MALNQSLAQAEIQVARIQGKTKLTQDQKQSAIRKLRSSVYEGKVGSFETVKTIANTMIGSSMILYPVLFIQDGLLSSTLMMLVVGVVQYWTCRILCLHNKPSQPDVSDTIKRVLGIRWYKANLITNIVLLYIVCVVYFLLIGANFYQLTGAFFESISDFTAPKASEITFKVYSSQWAGIIVMLIIYPLLFVKKIEGLLAFLRRTIYLVALYILFVIVMAFYNIGRGTIKWNDYILFSYSFSNVAGAFALAFTIHPVISPILKKNLQQQKNNRDLFFGYCLTAFIYLTIGILGAFACGNVTKDVIEHEYSTIFQCYPSTDTPAIYIISRIVQLCILIQNMSAFPILSFITRQQFLQIINKNNASPKISMAFTLSLIIISLLVHIFNLNVAAVVSFDGAIIGFIMVYLIPVYLHMKCMYHQYTTEQNQKRKLEIQTTTQSQNEMLMSVSLVDDESLECVKHPPENKTRDRILYTGIMAFGVAMGVFKIISFITS